MEVQVRQPLALGDLPRKLLVQQTGVFNVFTMGARAGECLILPRERMTFSEDTVKDLASALEWIVNRCNVKFRSVEGRPPEYSLSVRIAADGHLRFADYCPILNAWGAPDHVFSTLEGGPITLPWPHEVTAAYLRA